MVTAKRMPLAYGVPDEGAWWGRYRLQEGSYGFWQLGPLSLWLYHGAREWRVAHAHSVNALDGPVRVQVPCDPVDDLDHKPHMTRFACASGFDDVALIPLVADRSVVVKLAQPLYVLPNDEVRLYVSSPVWVQLCEAGVQQRVLQEVPSWRLSDTWFGAPTGPGELCYALRTFGCLRLEDVPRMEHRILTSVLVRNRAHEALYLDRLNIDLPRLAVYGAPDGSLWTPSITLERLEGQDLASLHLDKHPPLFVHATRFLAPARQKDMGSLWVRAFGTLFHG